MIDGPPPVVTGFGRDEVALLATGDADAGFGFAAVGDAIAAGFVTIAFGVSGVVSIGSLILLLENIACLAF